MEQTVERTWTKVGEEHTKGVEDTISEAIDNIEWFHLVKGLTLPAMPGLAIKACIKELNIPKVSRVGYGRDLAPYGLVAIEGNYKQGAVQIYVIDTGVECIPLCTDLARKEG